MKRQSAGVRVHVGSVADLDRDGRLVACLNGQPVMALRARDQVFAVQAACPHLGYSLAGAALIGGYVLECPFHRWRFDLLTGAAPRHWWAPPSSRNSGRRLQRLPVEVIDGQVFVSATGPATSSAS